MVLPKPTQHLGVGLGLRRLHLEEIDQRPDLAVDFFEVAPENWMKVGGRLGRIFRQITERYPFLAHGLSLSLGGQDPLDLSFLQSLRSFLDLHGMRGYSEHLSYSSHEGHLYDLMPIPFTEEAVLHVAGRIRQTQEILERSIAIENVSYYACPGARMRESEFICAVLEEADCQLLLDVNNIYVNSVNHGYDARVFLSEMPGERVVGFHVAGHYVEREDLLIDTHGAPVIDPVWDLLKATYEIMGVHSTLIERDFNLPALDELLLEIEVARTLQVSALSPKTVG